MEDCIFCKIAAGEIPSQTVFEDENLRVIADIAPANPGHLLILPKVHADDFSALAQETAVQVICAAQKIVRAMEKGLHPDGINVLQNNGEAAGQTVRHYHMHVIPRYRGDSVKIAWEQKKPGTDEIRRCADAVKAALEADHEP